MGDGFAQIFSQIVSIRVKKLSNTNYIASRHITREKSSLPVDVRCSKTSLLKLPIILLNLVPRALFLPKPRKSVLGTRLCFTHRNVDGYFKKNLREKGKADSYNKNNKILGSSYIYDSEGLFALSLGLINLRGQCVSGHVV